MMICPIGTLAIERTNELFYRVVNEMLNGSGQPLDDQCFWRLAALLRRFLQRLVHLFWYIYREGMAHWPLL